MATTRPERKRDPNKIDIFTPRAYQVELLEKATKKNIIVQLGTGAGKTFIAVMLIKEYCVQLRNSLQNGGRRAFFVVNNVALVEQQAEHINCHTPLIVGKTHGNLNQSIMFNKPDFDLFIENHQVVVLTAQVLQDLIAAAYLKITDIALLIFDECHHALGSNHPYRKIMDRYFECSTDARPRVLGLTASLINQKTDPRTLENMLSKLERILDCSIETTCDLVSVSKFGAKPKEVFVPCKDYHWNNPLCKIPLKFLDTVRTFVRQTQEFHHDLDVDPRKDIAEALHKSYQTMKVLGPWSGWKIVIQYAKWLQRRRKPCERIFGQKQRDFFHLGETALNTAKRLLDPKMSKIRTYESLKEVIPHKVQNLIDLLLKYNPEEQLKGGATRPEHLCAIVFVEQRTAAYSIKVLLKALAKWEPERFAFLKVDYVVGNTQGGDNFTEIAATTTEAEQLRQTNHLQDTLKKFRRGDLNVLVATNVLEEGVDVKHCNLVVRLDRPVNYRSYVQSKGRARKNGARYVLLVEESDADSCTKDLVDFQEIEALLLRRARSVHNPHESDLAVLGITSVDDRLPPYKVESTGAQVFLTGAISLINRYCGKLPSDIFTKLVPQNKIIPVEINGQQMYNAELLLPMNSPLKTSFTLAEPVPSKKLAQMMVALKTIEALHKLGELNDHLLPVGKESVLALLDEDPDEYVPLYNARVGSSKRKQLYDKKTASILRDAMPAANEELYIYVLDIDLVNPLSLEDNPRRRKLYNPREVDFCFGFLSKSKIPKIPPFSAFLRHGEGRVSVVRAHSTVTLNEQTFTYLRFFHHYIFRNVLQLSKDNLEFCLNEASQATLIVPLNRIRLGDGRIDYSLKMDYVTDVVNNMEQMPRVPSLEQRKEFKFVPAEWEDRVVMPWYRNVDPPMFCYVVAIEHESTPSTAFPDSEYTTFNEYFNKKYNLEIFDQEQNLLDVEYTSSRLNLLLPRARIRFRTAPKTTVSAPSQRQILVPELLDRHPISAQLWHSISALPSFFYRMNALLLADELRHRILVEALEYSEEKATVPEEWQWAPLYYPATFEEKTQSMVTRLDQLRDDKSEGGMSTKRRRRRRRGRGGGGGDDKSLLSGKADDSEDDEPQPTFDIGIWDPTLADGLMCDASTKTKVDGWLEQAEGAPDTPSSVDKGDKDDGEGSDDDRDQAMFFDLSNQFMGAGAARVFAAPREDIILETGWGDLPPENPADAPFMIVGPPSTQINLSGLMDDIAGVFGSGMEGGDSIGGPPALTPTPYLGPSTFGAVTSTTVEEAQGIPKALLERWESGSPDVIDEEDKDQPMTKPEESIDLITFDDEPTIIVPTKRKLGRTPSEEEREEISELEVGEQRKRALDAAAVAQSKEDIEEGCVLAAPLIHPRFSFHSPSKSHYLPEENTLGGPHRGCNPAFILTALTTSAANDGMNLERLETIGDSFLKYTVTDCLYHIHTDLHEGKLSFARSKEVSNMNLYRLGKRVGIPSLIVGNKFEVQDSWLPPCYIPTQNFKAPNPDDAELKDEMMERMLDGEEIPKEVHKTTGWDEGEDAGGKIEDGVETINLTKPAPEAIDEISPLPYNLLTQQHISDKSIADSVEALIGAHLLALGPQPTLKMMKWLGLKVLIDEPEKEAVLLPYVNTPTNPNCAEEQLEMFFAKFQLSQLEEKIGYRFNDKAFLLQAFTHASYYQNRITGCYQRLEFLGDAVLDYMITRFLFEHEKQYSPGVLTDLRSALVNNTIFASLAVKYDFHKHFVAMCPGLHFMIEKFVKLCKERKFFDANFNTEMFMATTEDEIDEGQEEDVEVPKAMGDIFESVAGAVYLDCGRDLDVVWRVFYGLMESTIAECCRNPPRSPVRELLEREMDRAKFSKLERIMETGKVRVTVEIGATNNKMRFTGMGRNYRIAKTTAAKRALRYLHAEDDRRKAETRQSSAEKTSSS